MDEDPNYTLFYSNNPNCSQLEARVEDANSSWYWNEICGFGIDTDPNGSNAGEPAGDIFQFIVLGIGISIVAILGKFDLDTYVIKSLFSPHMKWYNVYLIVDLMWT